MWNNLKYTQYLENVFLLFSSKYAEQRILRISKFLNMLELYNEAHSRLLNRHISADTYGAVRGRRVN